MDRRTFLTASGVAGLVGVSGCLARSGDDESGDGGSADEDEPELPDGMEIETHHSISHRLVDDPDGHHDRSQDERHFVVEDRETATDWADSAQDSDTPFIEETAFDEGYLLIVQNSMQSRPELDVVAIEHDGDRLAVDLLVDRPDGDISDDQAYHTLFVRITDDTGGIPDSVSVDIEGY